MAKTVFLSFRQTDSNLRNDLRSFFGAWGGPIQATPMYLTADVGDKGEAAIKQQIQEAMKQCSGVIVVIGEDVHSSEWIKYELQLADSWSIPRLGVRHPQSKGGSPNQFPALELISWDRDVIAKKVDSWPSR